ncbi:MAG: erythromycin esterase family protein [Myxococcales bacterium]
MGRETEIVSAVRDSATFLGGTRRDHDALLEMARDARLVLLGEPSHGSHEVYRERARISQRLIEELGFNAVVWEADWPDAERAGRYVRDGEGAEDAEQALAGFARFPTWMWRNTAVLEFVRWLRSRDSQLPPARRASIYGMDLYSLYASIRAVIDHLDRTDPAAAERARQRYSCFDHHAGDPQAYGYAARLGIGADCEEGAVKMLAEMQKRVAADGEHAFSAAQNARLARNAEAYYRSMFGSRIASWNLRDRHMAETLEGLLDFLGPDSRVIVWAHNSHLGDARATEMGEEGELNVGQLVRERFGSASLLVGFTTYDGTVTAAHEWDGPAERMRIVPALAGSIEAIFHDVGLPRFFLPLRDPGEALGALREPRLERAIGVIYRPGSERVSHYFNARVADQFDAIIHLDRTRAVEPLDRIERWSPLEPPESFPTGI